MAEQVMREVTLDEWCSKLWPGHRVNKELARLRAQLAEAEAEIKALAAPDPYDTRLDDWTRHPDPSGNNDTHWTCNYCGETRLTHPTARHACPERPAEPVTISVEELRGTLGGIYSGGLIAMLRSKGVEVTQ